LLGVSRRRGRGQSADAADGSPRVLGLCEHSSPRIGDGGINRQHAFTEAVWKLTGQPLFEPVSPPAHGEPVHSCIAYRV
jgi:hypothetical protein